jgi:hypothetical protein
LKFQTLAADYLICAAGMSLAFPVDGHEEPAPQAGSIIYFVEFNGEYFSLAKYIERRRIALSARTRGTPTQSRVSPVAQRSRAKKGQ